ncbi:MAG: GIY-YIG nuclease family protein [Bryobacteraceae bacterium]|jgi:hypothetical protein
MVDKREARKDFKSKITPKGVFAVRCAASDEAWVSASDHLDTARNGLWFQLRSGLHPNKRLQAAWNAHREAALEYQVLENFRGGCIAAAAERFVSREAEKLGAGVGGCVGVVQLVLAGESARPTCLPTAFACKPPSRCYQRSR